MRKVLCCSTQKYFEEKLSSEVSDRFKKRWDADEIIFKTITLDRDLKSDIDWEKMKKEGVEIVVMCDDPHSEVLHSFFQEAVFTVNLPTFWYSRYNSMPNLIQIKSFDGL